MPTGEGKIRAMTPVDAVANRTASAQLETLRSDPDLSGSAYQTRGSKVSIYFYDSL